MSYTVQIGYTTPAAVGSTTVTTSVTQNSEFAVGTNNLSFVKTNANSIQSSQVLISNGANQTVSFPTGGQGVLIVPPTGNVTLTSLSFGWANNAAPISPIAESDITFDPNNLPSQLVFNGSPSNLAIGIVTY